MSSKIRNVALLLPAFVLATGLAFAQPGVKVSTVNSNGTVTTTTITDNSTGQSARTPAVGGYWDGLASTDYFNQPPYIAAPPNPQIAVGPDDILTIVNRTIARYPNPNAGGAGSSPVANPYNNPPTEKSWLDVWLGVTVLSPQGGATALCPSGTGNNSICYIDNATIRYDQMQGRFVVLFTVTDLPAHRSNFVMIVSRFSQFTKCNTVTPPGGGCPQSSPLFTPPVIAPIVGGTSTGGVNSANWFLYTIPINLSYNTLAATGASTETTLGTGIIGAPAVVTTGGGTANVVTTPFCPNGGPAILNATTALTCTNYFPTGARMGFDNDNIILTAPVVDQVGATVQGTLVTAPGQSMGPYAGTRVVSIAKLVVYNATGLSLVQPPTCATDNPSDCQAVNLSDNTRTGTITTLGAVNPTVTGCAVTVPAATCASTAITGVGSAALPKIFWEPDNLRGRALASFDAQVSPFGNLTSGVVTPFDYLVGTQISDNYTGNFINDGATGTKYFMQPIVYSCPGISILPGSAGVAFCGTNSASQVADLAILGSLRGNAFTLGLVADPAVVGQGQSGTNMVANDGSPTTNKRLFVGDSRPQQVMFREGLLYIARTVRVSDSNTGGFNPIGSAAVLYDILKTCAGGAASPTCGAYSTFGNGITNASTAIETEWFNGTNVTDPAGNVNGFGFYQPMFESPADVVNSVSGGPTSPIALTPWFEKLFVGMTTGGTSNVAATFSKNYPSLWDFRPGDDAFDTIEPYLDPYTGTVTTTVPCPGDVTVSVLSKSGVTITVADPTGLGAGMFLSGTQTTIVSIAGNVVTLSAAFAGTNFPASAKFTRNQPSITTTATVVTAGSAQMTVLSAAGIVIGSSLTPASSGTITAFPAANTAFQITSTTNVGIGETIAGQSSTATSSSLAGVVTIVVPNTAQVGIGVTVSSTALGIASGVLTVAPTVNADGTLTVTLPAVSTPTVTGTGSVTFDASSCFPANDVVTAVSIGATTTVTISAASTCTAFVGVNPVTTGPINAGLPVKFSTNLGATFPTGIFPAGTTVANIVGNVITLSNVANAGASTTNVPFGFTAGSAICPMIPFGLHGGASTDPNDGSLWLYGEFAKNRLSTIPGPGEWGTSVANYALNFPAVDPYNNDNTFFQDVQPGNLFFTWIQIAKNIGIAVPASTGPCTINNGGTPIQQPPAPGTTPISGTSQLICPYFGPTTIVTRAEMAYWIVKSQMDEQQVTNYLCATGGDPSGTPCPGVSGGITSSSFADLTSITNPFISVPALGFPGVTNAQLVRYIEVMYRRGYTKGCNATDDPLRRYCPNNPVKRQEMAVFLIRAKMNNVFPTTLSGTPLASPYGDNFGLFLPSAYFSDVTNASTDPAADYYIYIQKLRELRITNGTGGSTFSPANSLTRQEITTFVVRAFFL